MALGSTQTPIEMSIRNVLGGKGRQTRKADKLTAVMLLFRKCWILNGSQPYGSPRRNKIGRNNL
jgi:hypothetical protein